MRNIIDGSSLSELGRSHSFDSDTSPFISVSSSRAAAAAYASYASVSSGGEVYEIWLPEGVASQNPYTGGSVTHNTDGGSFPDFEWLVPLYIPEQFVNNTQEECECGG